jgi:hypothetical protein
MISIMKEILLKWKFFLLKLKIVENGLGNLDYILNQRSTMMKIQPTQTPRTIMTKKIIWEPISQQSKNKIKRVQMRMKRTHQKI